MHRRLGRRRRRVGHGPGPGLESDSNGQTLIERLPRVAEQFLAGEIDARVVGTIINRTELITDEIACAQIDELIAEKLLTAAPGAEGYRVIILPSPDAVSYTAEATPAVASARHFFTDKTGVIRGEIGKPATAGSSEF